MYFAFLMCLLLKVSEVPNLLSPVTNLEITSSNQALDLARRDEDPIVPPAGRA